MKLSDNTPPGNNPFKAMYMQRDLKMISLAHNIPINIMPPVFPINTVKAMRFLTLLSDMDPKIYENSIQALFRAYWAEENPKVSELLDMATITNNFLQTKGLKIIDTRLNDLAAQVNDNEVKIRLRNNTEKLFYDHGAFGCPWISIIADKSSDVIEIWGSDRFEYIAALCGVNLDHSLASLSKL